MIDELIGLSAARDFPNGQFVHSHTFRGERAQHGIADASVCIMVLDRQESSAGGSRAIEQRRPIHRHDAVEVDHAGRDTGRLQLIVSF